jgi:hypothetical protein
MSWDILIQDLPRDIASVADVPDDFRPQPLGLRSDVIAAICNLAPSSDFSDPTWGELVTPEFIIEFNLGTDEIIDSIMLHVRGGGAAPSFVAALLKGLDTRAIDCSTGELFNADAADRSFADWQAFRDNVLMSEDGGSSKAPAPTSKRRWFRPG